ncbi:hypothetical protein ACFWB7_02225 [Streptomyces solisilvae]|uniref:Gp37-like protein n=1 Tax=Streptomyces malaysiensis TaxID=92644 RepID=UPI00368A74E5
MGEVDEFISLDFTVSWNAQGSWQLLMKNGTRQANLFEKGGGVAIYQDGVEEPLLTGAIESFQTYWTTVQHTEEGSMFIGGHCDNKLAYNRLAFPDPAKSAEKQFGSEDSRTISAKDGNVIWDELSKALGPAAIAGRQEYGVVLDDTHVAGADTINDSLRFDNIGTKIEEWLNNRNVGYRFVWDADLKKIVLKVYTTRDRTKQIRFSKELGNLREYIWTLSTPRTTRAIVACQGTGSRRYIFQKIATEAEREWNIIIEAFTDRRDVPLQLSANGVPELVTTESNDGFEDIGTNADGGEWTTGLATARTNYTNAATAVETAQTAVETAQKAVDDAQKAVDDAKTDAEKAAANTKLTEAKANLATKNNALTNAKSLQTQYASQLKSAITAAKPTAVAYWQSVVEDAADSVLEEGAPSGNLQIYPIDTPQIQFGRDYFVGDVVTFMVDDTEYTDVLREVTITVSDGGKTTSVAPKIGDQGTGNPLNLYKTVFEMREKLRKLEARM